MASRFSASQGLTIVTALTGPSGRRWVSVLLKLAGSGLGVLVLIAAVVGYLLTLRPDIEGARRLATSELGVLMEAGERVTATALVRRRAWWDGFRETYGVLAVTDRRALFVGIPPRELISPERGPQQFLVQQLGRDSAGVQAVLTEIARGVRTAADARELQQRTRAYEERVARLPVWHVVAPGDALASVASRYGTTEAQLITLNRLTNTTIRIGQRLLVHPGR
jgi:hypothetical protein